MSVGDKKSIAASLDEARTIEAEIRQLLAKLDPSWTLGLGGCILMAARTIGGMATTREEMEALVAEATTILTDRARAHFAARQKHAKRGRRNATHH